MQRYFNEEQIVVQQVVPEKLGVFKLKNKNKKVTPIQILHLIQKLTQNENHKAVKLLDQEKIFMT